MYSLALNSGILGRALLAVLHGGRDDHFFGGAVTLLRLLHEEFEGLFRHVEVQLDLLEVVVVVHCHELDLDFEISEWLVWVDFHQVEDRLVDFV